MSLEALYQDHLTTLDGRLAESLEQARAAGVEADTVVIHAGREAFHYADDHAIPFQSTPHFRHWVPLSGPEHVVVLRPGQRPRVVRVSPRDFWYDTAPAPRSYWEQAVDLIEVESFDAAVAAVGSLSRAAFIGESRKAAEALGIELIDPPALLAPMDWHRASKTAFELDRIRTAARAAGAGFASAVEVFAAGGSERELYWAYLEGSGQVDHEQPFPPIVALDEKGAILHYQHKRGAEAAPGRVFLLDAGAACDGWACDVTRTWARDDVDAQFLALLHGMDALERTLVAKVAPGVPFGELHRAAHQGIAALLIEVGLARASAEELLAAGATRAFLPHGLGHHLGIQVHDVGGHMAGPDGSKAPPPPEYPALRNTRVLQPGHVVTIEPGFYFIPMLLEPLRRDHPTLLDWAAVERLTPYGGIRIEDDVVCTNTGYEDLTREHLPGPRDTSVAALGA
jgi:Xaa-Pro dipeptidase